jgi:signal transduction histidine kinase
MLWLGTLRGGLVKFDRNAQIFASYCEKDGLANDVVYGILEDAGGSLWISTNRGISNFNPGTETFKNYDVHDSLQSNEFNSNAYHQSRSGEMYFGGVNGVNAFYPENIRVNPYIPPVVITQVAKYDEVIKSDISESTNIELSYKDKYLRFEFVSLDFRNSRKNQYAYMLEGFDTSWIHSNARRYVSYTNLDPGQYTFRAKGSSSDGIWNERGVSIELVVTPPFWELWWFRLAIAMLVCGAALGWHNLRIRHIRDLNKTLESKVAERTSEIQKTMQKLKDTQIQLVQSEKMASLGTLAAGVAHEVNSPMGVVESAADVSKRCISKITDIIGKSSKLDEIKQDPGFRKAVELMYQNNSLIISASQAVSKIVQSLRNFARLDESDIKFDDIHIGIDNTLILLRSRIKDRIQIVREYGNLPLVCCSHSQMNQVFMNLLSNAIESIDNQGVITISTSTVDQQVVIAIKDDGKGIPPDQIDKIFNPGFTTKGVGVGTGLGLSICYNIIEKHKGVLQVNSELGQGTEFTITIPINNVAEGLTGF